MYRKNFEKGLSVMVITLKTEPGWEIRWQVDRLITNGYEPIIAMALHTEEEISEGEAIERGMTEGENYIANNL